MYINKGNIFMKKATSVLLFALLVIACDSKKDMSFSIEQKINDAGISSVYVHNGTNFTSYSKKSSSSSYGFNSTEATHGYLILYYDTNTVYLNLDNAVDILIAGSLIDLYY
jgi:hypothetical protein